MHVHLCAYVQCTRNAHIHNDSFTCPMGIWDATVSSIAKALHVSLLFL